MLRAGALAAPIDFVEERTVGPSLGADNIVMGLELADYRLGVRWCCSWWCSTAFSVISPDLALAFNVMLLLSVMSMLGATLTLPGIAGIVLTMGMAVDANVLIFSRIREELANGHAAAIGDPPASTAPFSLSSTPTSPP